MIHVSKRRPNAVRQCTYHPPTVVDERQANGPRCVQCLAGGDRDHVAPARLAREAMRAHTAFGKVDEVGERESLHGHEPVEDPPAHMLIAVPWAPWLAGCQAGERRLIDVGVHTCHVGVAMVQVVVLEPPDPRTRAEHVAGVARDAVDGVGGTERCMVAVVHHAGRGGRGRNHEDCLAYQLGDDVHVHHDQAPVAGEAQRGDDE